MRKKKLMGKQLMAISLSATLAFSCFPTSAFAASNTENLLDIEAQMTDGQKGSRVADNVVTLSPETDFTLGEQALLVDNNKGGKALHIKTSWVSGSAGMAASAAFKDASIFVKNEFTLHMNVYRIENGNANNASKVAFSVGNADSYFSLRLSNTGSLTSSKASQANFTKNPMVDRKFNAVALSYTEDSTSGKVTVYVNGEKILDQADIGFKLSTLTDVTANIGGGRGTGFMMEGVYDDIQVSDTAATGDTLEVVSRYQPYSTFSGVRASYGGALGNSVQVAEWLDTNGNHIQAHGGQVQWLDTLDLDGDGTAEGGWIWYGEDKSRNGKPIDGIHCYTSSDLYNWTDRGMALYTHDVVPEKMNEAQDGILPDEQGLANLKTWADMETPSSDVTQEQIDMARNFVAAYKTADGYDEENLAKAYKYLFSGYCIAERPKMLYNATTKKYVLVYHADGPTDENILKYLKENTSPSRYSRASMGFAVSDTPYGPFKLINVQRMNYKTGEDYATNTGMARDMTVFLDDTDINKDGVKDAYAIYSSENNKYMYVSLLNSDYTGPITEGTTDTMTLEDGTEIQTFADRVLGTATDREAPAIFKYQGYYYMITSGTSGWEANAATYYRAKNIYGPWTALGDPCEGTSNTTFVSQPTAVIPVNTERGKFIYMGDRWSYTKSGNSTDSAHWDSSYVWLPIDINNNTIMMPNVSDWDLSVLDKTTINTKLPTRISSIEDLPTEINVTTDDGTFDTTVTWESFENADFTVKRVTGTMTDLENRTVSINVAVAPENMIYFVDAGTEGTEGSTFYQLVKDYDSLKNNRVSEQAYSSENKWGYLGDNTIARNSTSLDLYERFRYVNSESDRTLSYQFDGLEEGNYSIYLGFYDPTGWYKEGMRVGNLTLRQGESTLKTGEVTCGGKGVGTISEFENLSLKGTDGLQMTLEPKNTGEGSDMQISWIAIVKEAVEEKPHEHSYTYKDNGDGTHTATCKDNDDTKIENHSYTEENTCICGAKKPTTPVEKEDIKDATITLKDGDIYTYTGKEIKPEVTVVLKDQTLTTDDYTVTYENNTAVGTATITVTGKGKYTGTAMKTFEITEAEQPPIEKEDIKDATITLKDGDTYTYTGKEIKPEVTVVLKDQTLTTDDYTVTYENNTAVGTATITVTGKGKYTGTATKNFTIKAATTPVVAKDLKDAVLTLSQTSYVYDGKKKTPAVTVKLGTQTLKKDTDYTVAYTNNINAGTATVTVKAKGTAYKGTKTITFKITKKDIKKAVITLKTTKYTYNGKQKKPAVTKVTLDKVKLTTKNYSIAYSNNVNAGTAKVTITGKGNYTGKATKNFTINKASAKITLKSTSLKKALGSKNFTFGASVNSKGKLTYTSSNKKVIKIDKSKGKVVAIGEATITVKAAATKNYKATSKKLKVTVTPKKATLSTVSSKKAGQLSIKWKKDSKASGYMIQYSTSKKFTKKTTKTKTIKSNKTTSYTIKKLPKGKTYYVKVCAYKKVTNKKNICGAYSAVKKVKIKK